MAISQSTDEHVREENEEKRGSSCSYRVWIRAPCGHHGLLDVRPTFRWQAAWHM